MSVKEIVNMMRTYVFNIGPLVKELNWLISQQIYQRYTYYDVLSKCLLAYPGLALEEHWEVERDHLIYQEATAYTLDYLRTLLYPFQILTKIDKYVIYDERLLVYYSMEEM